MAVVTKTLSIKSLKTFRNLLINATKLSNSASSSIDSNEIKKFQQLSNEWWTKGGEMQVLQNMNKLRVPFIRDGLINTGIADKNCVGSDQPLKGVKILDVGCGGGFLAEPLARLGANVTGIDAAQNLIDIAKAHKEKNLHLQYEHTTIEDFSPRNKDVFDCVVSSEVVEHVVEKKQFLSNIVGCLKPGGSVIITTMSQTMLANILGICVAENVFQIVPKGTHEYDKFITPHKLQAMLDECKLLIRPACTVF